MPSFQVFRLPTLVNIHMQNLFFLTQLFLFSVFAVRKILSGFEKEFHVTTLELKL